MKILHIIPSYMPAWKYGGPIQSVHLLCKELVKKRIDVTVYTTNAGLPNTTLKKETIIDGVKVYYFKYYGYEHYNFSPSLTFALYKNLKDFDLIHITAVWNYPVLIGGFLCQKFNKPYVISPRGTLVPSMVKKKSYLKKKLYYNLILKKVFEKANSIHYTSENEYQRTHNLATKYCIIANGIELEDFKSLPQKGEFKKKYPTLNNKRYILFLGRINWKKGLDLLSKSFGLLAKEYKDLWLVIVGPESERYTERVKKWLKEEKVIEKTIFTGLLLGKDKLSAFVDAELFVLPSYYENFGMSVIEAMACKTPVVISDRVDIYKELINYNTGIVAKCEAKSLYQAMKEMLNNKKLCQESILNGEKLVKEKFDIKNVTWKMLKLYNEILNE